MKILCAFGRYQYGQKERGTGIEYEAFIPALKKLGHEVRHFDTWDTERYPDYSALNHALMAEARDFRPDILFTVQMDYEIWTETLLELQKMEGLALLTWTTDDSFKFPMVSRYIGPYYDAISTTYSYRMADYKAAGIEGAYCTQWAANSHWMNPPKPAVECRYPVSFIGAAYGGRAETVEKLKKAGIDVECFGHGWPNGSIASDQIPVVMRDSVISLNFNAAFKIDAGNDMQIKARTFEVPGAGGFLLTDAAVQLNSVYQPGEEIATYGSFEELEQKIRYYLAHPEERDRIACAGYLKTAACHTYEQRLKGLLDFTLERRDARLRKQGSAALTKSEEVGDGLPFPQLGVTLRAVRWSLVKSCSLVWGPEWGPRAARRMVFEVTRRVCGARTFGARSIPGRMFPYV